MPVVQLNEGRKRWEIDRFTGGINLFGDASLISEDEFLVFENLIGFNEEGYYGNGIVRPGYQIYNSNSPANGGANKIISLIEYISNNKAVNFNRILVKTNNSLEYFTGTGAMTVIGNSEADGKVRGAVIKDNAYICNRNSGNDVNKVYDGTNYLDWGCPPCMQTFTLETLSSGAINSTRGYIILFEYENGQYGSFVPKKRMDSSFVEQDLLSTELPDEMFIVSITASNEKIAVKNIPTGNARVKARVILCTKSTDNNNYYYHSRIADNTTKEFIDNKADAELTVVWTYVHTYKPYTSEHVIEYDERLWAFNLKENQYSAPDVSGVLYTTSNDGSANMSQNNTRKAKYSYKFAKDYRVYEGVKRTAVNVIKAPFQGLYGKLSAAVNTVMTANNDNKIALDKIPESDEWSGHFGVFRNMCHFVKNVERISATAARITTCVNAAEDARCYLKTGETVTIEGITYSAGNNINGDRVITKVDFDNGYFEVNFDLGGSWSYTTGSGIVKGGNYYLIGHTRITGSSDVEKFTDILGDDQLGLNQEYTLGFLNLSTKEAGDEKLASTGVYTDKNKPDVFPALNVIPVYPNDNGTVKKVFYEPDGLVIFKNNGIYKYITLNKNSELWSLVKRVSHIGCTDGFACVQLPETTEYVFLGPKNKIYHWFGGTSKPLHCSRKIYNIIKGLTFTNIDMAYDAVNNYVRIVYSTADYNGRELIYDLNDRDDNGIGKWYHSTENTNALKLRQPLITNDGKVIFGSEYNKVMYVSSEYRDEKPNNDDTTTKTAIKVKIGTKRFERYSSQVKAISGKFYMGGTGQTGNISPVLTVNESDTPLTAMAIASGFNNVHKLGVNKNADRFSLQLEFATSYFFAIRYLAIEFADKHEARGA
jgi:hypothetical protein